MNERLLFVTPNLSTGGTNSSLSSLYDAIKDDFEIDVFAISHHGHAKVSFKDALLPQRKLLSLWFCVYEELEYVYEKIPAFFIKIARRLFIKVGLDMDKKICVSYLNKIHVLQYDFIVAFQEGIATRFVSLANHPNKIAWIHCDYSKSHPVITPIEKEIYFNIHQIVCVSQYTADSFNRLFNLSPCAIAIHNIQNTDSIKKQGEFPITEKEWDNEAFSIISVGRLHPVKRFSSIPDIANQLLKSNLSFKWYVIGPAFSLDELQKLQEGIKRYNLQNCVFYLGNKENPYPYFSKADLFVCLSESEACPMVFNEAKVFGTPVVTTDFGSAYEFINKIDEGIVSSRIEIPNAIEKYIIAGKKKGIKNSYALNDNSDIKNKINKLFSKS